MLRECGWRVEVVAVAWEQELLGRAEWVMRSWVGGDVTEAGRELLILRWAVSSADRETVERHGGLDVVMEKIDQWEQEDPLSDGLEMIDDFRLRGSRTCRRRGGPLTKGGWRTWWRVPSTTPTLHSQRAKFSPLWSSLFPETRIGHGLARISRVFRGKAPSGADLRVARLAWRVVALHGRGRWW